MGDASYFGDRSLPHPCHDAGGFLGNRVDRCGKGGARKAKGIEHLDEKTSNVAQLALTAIRIRFPAPAPSLFQINGPSRSLFRPLPDLASSAQGRTYRSRIHGTRKLYTQRRPHPRKESPS